MVSSMATDYWEKWSQAELDRQLSPSQWSKRFDREAVIQAHIQAGVEAFTAASATVPVEEISYGPTEGQKMYIFRHPSNPPDAPIFAFIHGGYWQELDKRYGSFGVPVLASHTSCTIISIGYDLAPKVKLGVMVGQIQTAARHIVQMAKNANSRGIYFAGHSAGAQLASMIATSSWLQDDQQAQNLIKGYICISGVYNLKPLVTSYINAPLQMTNQEAADNSPMFLIERFASNTAKECTFLVVIGENETPEFLHQSQVFHKALQKANLRTQYILIPKVDHFDIIENLDDGRYILMQTIISLIKQTE